jgi:tRNA (guanine-N7-)-methyltransferase
MSQTFELKPEYKQKAIRSYVIRGGRITEAQKKAFDNAWPIYGLSLFDGLIDPVTIFDRQAPVVLEVGFGMGDSLLQMAIAQPETDFIGIEVHPPGVGRLINNAAKEGLTNLRVYMADAIDVLEDCIADNSLSRFQLYFPDPCSTVVNAVNSSKAACSRCLSFRNRLASLCRLYVGGNESCQWL